MNVPRTQAPLLAENGDYREPRIGADGGQYVAIIDPLAAYGSVSVSERTPQWNIDCTYGAPSGFYMEYSTGATGSVGGEDGAMVLSTGTNATGFVSARSQLAFRPRAGRGIVVDVCAKFSAAQADSYQLVGPYTAEDGVALAYDDTGTLTHYQKTGGIREVQTLTLSAASTGSETVTITLDGEATQITVGAGTTAQNANSIAAETFTGWTTYAVSNTVIFVSGESGALAGAFSVSSTGTLAGTFAETVAGAAGTESFVPQSSWNIDKMDGTGSSGFTLDPTKVFSARWVLTEFLAEMQIRTTDGYRPAHRVTTLESTNGKLFQNPTLKLQFVTYNAGNTSDVKVHVFTAGASINGMDSVFAARRGISRDETGLTDSTDLPVISLRNRPTFGNPARVFTGRSIIRDINLANRGAKGARAQIIRGTTLTAPAWADVSANGVLQTDTAATAYSGGIVLKTITVPAGQSIPVDVSNLNLYIEEGDVFTISVVGTSSSSTDVTIDLGVVEDR